MKQSFITITLLLFVSAVKTIEVLSEYPNLLDSFIQMVTDEEATSTENMREAKSSNDTHKDDDFHVTRANILLPENKKILDVIEKEFNSYGIQQKSIQFMLVNLELSVNKLYEKCQTERTQADELTHLLQHIFQFIVVTSEELRSAKNLTDNKLEDNFKVAKANNKLLGELTQNVSKYKEQLYGLRETMEESLQELAAQITDDVLPKFNVSDKILPQLEKTQLNMENKLELLHRLNSLSENIFVNVRTLNNSVHNINNNSSLGNSDTEQLLKRVMNLQNSINSKFNVCHNSTESVDIELKNLTDSQYALQTQVDYLKNLTDERINELKKMMKITDKFSD